MMSQLSLHTISIAAQSLCKLERTPPMLVFYKTDSKNVEDK